MAKRPYRIHFVASWDRVVEADGPEEVQALADELQAAGELLYGVEDLRVRWNTIEPEDG